MRIGVDLDNTIICYGPLFHAVAVAKKLVPSDLAPSKAVIKAWIQNTHGNHVWTALQAEIYGPLLEGAAAYPGVFDFFAHCREAGIKTCIISHKSQFPALGVRTDLRVAAVHWLEKNGWFSPALNLGSTDVEFHDSRQEKILAITRRSCDIFIDDLPEVFGERNFPSTTLPIIFAPDDTHLQHTGIRRISQWYEIEEAIFSEKLT
jgi:hypothetical protein